jgi:hypothetical protein
MTFKISSAGTRGPAPGARRAGETLHPSKLQRWLWPIFRKVGLPLGLVFRRGLGLAWLMVPLLLALAAGGCGALSPAIPAADLSEPGWVVREGQAVWRLPKAKAEIAGEVLIATREDGRAFVQFTKSPFPMVVAQATARSWKIEFPPQRLRYSGRGVPPRRLIWLHVPRLLSGKAPPRGWTWRKKGTDWCLENPTTQESLEGYSN